MGVLTGRELRNQPGSPLRVHPRETFRNWDGWRQWSFSRYSKDTSSLSKHPKATAWEEVLQETKFFSGRGLCGWRHPPAPTSGNSTLPPLGVSHETFNRAYTWENSGGKEASCWSFAGWWVVSGECFPHLGTNSGPAVSI